MTVDVLSTDKVNGNHIDDSKWEFDPNDLVLIGPDLNTSKSASDKKLYRQFILKQNGLRVILISDVLALSQKQTMKVEDENDEKDDENDDSSECGSNSEFDEKDDLEEYADEEKDDDDDSYEEDEDEDGMRKAAAALVVGAGSSHDPPQAMGMAHFLEHMLFMGTKKYPTENAYDSFLSGNGGSDNAYTEMEHTVFHFDIPQEKLFQAMDMFAQFFIDPLLLPDAVDRELNSIESEFQLVKNSDACRLEEIMFHTSGKDSISHPFNTFAWGNMRSLREIPEKNNIDTLAELRKFYDQHYYASNMNLVVIGGYSLDELQEQVIKSFSEIPPNPRVESPFALTSKEPNAVYPRTWEDIIIRPPMKKYGMPFATSSLGKVYRMNPVKDRHSLTVTWQIPPQQDNWRSKPTDYISHLLGHEGKGSLLSALKKKSWVTSCYAGVGSQGYEYASSHALFTLSYTLSDEGVKHWHELTSLTYSYIGLIRHYCISTDGLPKYLFDELQTVNEASYKFADEQNPADFVEELVDDLSSDRCLPPDRVLDGYSLLFNNDEKMIKDLLDQYLIPTNARLDIMSSTFGRTSELNKGVEVDYDGKEHTSDAVEFDPDKAGIPFTEPEFGAKFWCHKIPVKLMESWKIASEPHLPPEDLGLHLPSVNPFIPTEFGLKPLPSNETLVSDGEMEQKDSHVLETDQGAEPDNQFPTIPPPLPEYRLPKLVTDNQSLKLWWLQDRKFKRPVAELRLLIVQPNSNKDPLHRACSDLLLLLWKDAVTEFSYQASIAELATTMSNSDIGLGLRVNGFDHKLQALCKELLTVLLSFAGRSSSDGLPSMINERRFDACVEILRRRYTNAGMQPSSMSTNVRLECLRAESWSCTSKLQALEDIDVSKFLPLVSSMLNEMFVEALYHGNCDKTDAEQASKLITEMLTSYNIKDLNRSKFPSQHVSKIPMITMNEVLKVPTKDKDDKNVAVEAYFQVGPDNVEERILTDLLGQFMYEPLYDQVRTKDQFGYQVSVDVKWSFGIMGLCFKVVSSSKTSVEIRDRLEKFIIDFREYFLSMENHVFIENVVGLAKNKLEMYNSLEEECGDLWSEIVDFRYDWQSHLSEVAHLQNVTKKQVLEAFDSWIFPNGVDGKPQSRRLITIVVEGGDNEGNKDPGLIVDERVKQFHEAIEHENWGIINFRK